MDVTDKALINRGPAYVADHYGFWAVCKRIVCNLRCTKRITGRFFNLLEFTWLRLIMPGGHEVSLMTCITELLISNL